jgi:hypothetical protein
MIKKEVFLLLALLLIPSVLAVDISLKKQSYYPRETLQAEISGGFISLEKENVFIYENGIPRPEPVISDLTKQGPVYYFYAVLPNKEGNFSLKIQNAEYSESGVIKSDDLVQNFTIAKGNASALSINPGFIASSKDFSVKITSLLESREVTAVLDNQSKTVFLTEDFEKRLDFNLPQEDSVLTINGYEIPVFVIRKDNVSDNRTYYGKVLLFSPDELVGTILIQKDYFFTILLENKGDEDISNINLTSNIVNLDPKNIDFLGQGNVSMVNISINTNKTENVSGNIVVSFDDSENYIPVFFEVTENESEVVLNRTTISDLHCYEMRGESCDYGEVCNGETVGSLEGPCCIGRCFVEGDEPNTNWIFGIALVLVVVFLGFLIWKKAKKKKGSSKKGSKDILKDRTKKYKDRMAGKLPSERDEKIPPEVSGKLEKI